MPISPLIHLTYGSKSRQQVVSKPPNPILLSHCAGFACKDSMKAKGLGLPPERKVLRIHSRVDRPFSRYLSRIFSLSLSFSLSLLSLTICPFVSVSAHLLSQNKVASVVKGVTFVRVHLRSTGALGFALGSCFNLRQVKTADRYPENAKKRRTAVCLCVCVRCACLHHSLAKWNGVSPSLNGTSHDGTPSTRPLHTPASTPFSAPAPATGPPPLAAAHGALQSRNSSTTVWPGRERSGSGVSESTHRLESTPA